MTKGEVKRAKESAKEDKLDYGKYRERIEKLPKQVKSRLQELERKLARPNISDKEKSRISREMKDLVSPYMT